MMQGTLKKIKTTGTDDPLNARLMFGIMELRDFMVERDEEKRLAFDKFYGPVLDNMEEAQEHMTRCLSLIEDHRNKVVSGEIIKFQRDIIEVDETIDKELNNNFKDFFIKGQIALKALSPLSNHLGYSVGFFFQDDKEFEAGKEKFTQLHKDKEVEALLKMLEDDRKKWYRHFREMRVKFEHEGASLPDIKYVKSPEGKVMVLFPTIGKYQISEYFKIIWFNLFEFVEGIVVSLIAFNLKPPLIIRALPEEQRDKSFPKKYIIWAEGFSEFLEEEAKKNSGKS